MGKKRRSEKQDCNALNFETMILIKVKPAQEKNIIKLSGDIRLVGWEGGLKGGGGRGCRFESSTDISIKN